MTYLDATVNLGNYDFAANGKTTKDGHIVKYSCRGGKTKADGGATNYTYTYVPNGTPAPAAPPPLPPPPPPPPDPNDLALTASKTLTMPKPHIHWGPLPDQVVVNYPLWLWVDNPGVIGTSVSLRGVTVTMNATIDKIIWRTGEPTDPGNGSSPQTVVECQGPGEPAPSVEEVAQVAVADRRPACGYAYRWKSTPERTGGSGTWTMTAEVDWTLAWTSTINGTPGPRGAFALQSTNTAPIQVLELKSALIAPPHRLAATQPLRSTTGRTAETELSRCRKPPAPRRSRTPAGPAPRLRRGPAGGPATSAAFNVRFARS